MIKLSVAIIAKNEEVMLPLCLDSVKEADEIIVIDTWSQDSTLQIARDLWCKIWWFEWCDDFSAARNYAKNQSTNEWVLSIDCDEVLEKWWIANIKRCIEELSKTHPEIDAIKLHLTSWWTALYNTRVFKKHLRWTWRIHENIEHTSAASTDITITYGRSPAHDLDPHLDLRIMEQVYKDEPDNARNMFYLWREYFYYNRYDDAERILLEYIGKSFFYAELVEAYFILALCYWHNGKSEWWKAREFCMWAISRNPHFKWAILLMAEMSHEREKKRWLEFAENADNSNLLFIH